MGAFVIFNTLSITVAQRVREFATLRTIGASRRQILGSVILEALVIGLLASVAGLFLGLGLAKGLTALFDSIGFDLPSTSLVFAGRTILVSLLAGVLVTLVAALFPAIRATRVPPIAAVREGATLPRSRWHRFTPWIGGLVTALGVALLLYGTLVDDLGVTERLTSLGVGCLVLFIGFAMVSRYFVKPLVRALGWPGEKIAGRRGRLARENSTRNPARTAATAAALMIGLALITFVAMFASGLRSSISEAVNDQVNASYVVVSDDNFTPFEPSVDEALASVPGTEIVGVRGGRGKALDGEENVTGVDPQAIADVYNFDWTSGSNAVLADLGDNGAILEESYADDHDLQVGSRFELLSPNGQTLDLEVKGIYDAPAFWQMLGARSASRRRRSTRRSTIPATCTRSSTRPAGRRRGIEQQLEQAIADFPAVKVDTSDGFSQAQQDSINPLLYMFYVLLALSVIVSLFGIVNTLVSRCSSARGSSGCSSGGDDATPGPPDDPAREHRHRADRGRARTRTGHRARGARDSRALERGPRLLGPGGQPGGVRDRRGHRGDARGDLPGPARGEAQRAPGAPVRVIGSTPLNTRRTRGLNRAQRRLKMAPVERSA